MPEDFQTIETTTYVLTRGNLEAEINSSDQRTWRRLRGAPEEDEPETWELRISDLRERYDHRDQEQRDAHRNDSCLIHLTVDRIPDPDTARALALQLVDTLNDSIPD